MKNFKLDNDKGCFITGEPGTGKTYMCKGLQQEILKSFRHGNCFKVCTPTHKSALIAKATTIFNLFNNTFVPETVNDDITEILSDVILLASMSFKPVEDKPQQSI